MRIRRRPAALQPSPSSDPSPQQPPKEETALHHLHQHGDLPDPLLQSLHPMHKTCHLLKEEKVQVMDSQTTGDHNSSLWCNREGSIDVTRRKRRGNGAAPIGSASGDRTGRSATGEGGKGKKRASPVLMEGSRCSRVNGRGWRCCQKTLVGYSLCEHHLGKGRLRSMNNIRGRKPKNVGATSAPEEDEGRKKARSMSSLLDETDNAAAAIITSLTVPVLDIDKGYLV